MQRLITWLPAALFSVAIAADAAPVVRASSGSKEFSATAAFDANWTTRWDSERSDPQWLQADFGAPRELIGLIIDWEKAYAYSYAVMLSSNGTQWHTVFETASGDGGRDQLDFPRQSARYLRIYCRNRATAFGYSIYEIDLKTPRAPWGEQQAADYFARPFPATAPGHWQRTYFIPAAWTNHAPFIELANLPGDFSLTINDTLVYTNGPNQSLTTIPLLGHLRFDTTNTFKVRSAFVDQPTLDSILIAGGPKLYSHSMTRLKHQQPLNYYKLQARLSPTGWFPYWLTDQQGYWTITGAENDRKESLFGQDGTIEPYKSFSISPFLRINDAFITREQVALTQSLADGYLPLPRVTWNHPDFTFTIDAFSWGPPDRSSTYVSYTLANLSAHCITGALYLAVRPFEINPPWQWGGLNRLDTLSFDARRQRLQANEYRIHSFTPPAAFAAAPPEHPGITARIGQGNLPTTNHARDPSGTASGALIYPFTLAAGDHTAIETALLLHPGSEPAPSFAAARHACHDHWRRRLQIPPLPGAPETVKNTFAANLAYILINRDGPSIQPGSRAYEAAWIRDAAGTTKALLRCGFTNEVREFITWYSRFIFDNGRIPAIIIHNQDNQINPVKEYDSQGQFVTLLYNYFAATGDRPLLLQQYTNIIRALTFLQHLRESECRTEYLQHPDQQRYYGILPKSVSHEGYYPEPGNHSYWDNFWALLGWTNGIRLATALSRTNDMPWMQHQYALLADALTASISNTMDHFNINHLPGCAELGDFDPSSSAAAIVFGTPLPQLSGILLTNTFNRYWYDLSKRFAPDWTGSFSPYELRNVTAFLQLGWTNRAQRLFDYLLTLQQPHGWHQWPEALYLPPDTPGYIGDMPHTWIAGEFINTSLDLYDTSNPQYPHPPMTNGQ
jgi:hypothetical protein